MKKHKCCLCPCRRNASAPFASVYRTCVCVRLVFVCEGRRRPLLLARAFAPSSLSVIPRVSPWRCRRQRPLLAHGPTTSCKSARVLAACSSTFTVCCSTRTPGQNIPNTAARGKNKVHVTHSMPRGAPWEEEGWTLCERPWGEQSKPVILARLGAPHGLRRAKRGCWTQTAPRTTPSLCTRSISRSTSAFASNGRAPGRQKSKRNSKTSLLRWTSALPRFSGTSAC